MKMKAITLTSLLMLSIPWVTSASSPAWRNLAPGLQYTALSPFIFYHSKKIHAFRIDLKRYPLMLVTAHQQQQSSFFVTQAAPLWEALVAINGGFFTPRFQPLGLRIQNGKILSPLKKTPWWGIFIMQNHRAQIVGNPHYRYSPHIRIAIQAGPRLVIDGRIPSLKGGLAARSALCLTKKGDLLILITDNLTLTTREFATILQSPEKQGGLACYNALNLDGGTSSQLYAAVRSWRLAIDSVRPVADMIVVTSPTPQKTR
ncbi:MAG: hypothetical protein A3F41_05335 [Coxiella sp. RIFCSPHIGHO2_12_FULL_44_14]|nr:MAG: hypothetical protein A3F41_05335 [Coxiella sp. RIFCSPHIGHO2_12_FULL_44_14]